MERTEEKSFLTRSRPHASIPSVSFCGMESKYDDDEEEVKSGDYGDSKGGDEDSEDEAAAVEREFKALLNTPLKGELAVSKVSESEDAE